MPASIPRAATLVAAACLLAVPTLLGAAAPDDPRDLIAKAKVSLRDAIARATNACPGTAIAVGIEDDEMEGEHFVVWEVVVAGNDDAWHEVVVDAVSGKVLDDDREDDEEAQDHLAAARALLRHVELSLAQLVEKAGGIVHGRAIGAAYEFGDGGPECEVVMANGRYLIELDFEARAGHLIDLEFDNEFCRDEDGEEEDEDGEEEEDDERSGDQVAYRAPTPLADGTLFSARIDHRYFPLSRVPYAEFESESEKVIREVQADTREVAGVECLVLAEREYEDGELVEISLNFFAQDFDGNVWYFGEEVDDYESGEVVGHGGAWLVGRNAEEPCLFMPAKPKKGTRFKRENSPPDAEEFDQIAGIIGRLEVPAQGFSHVLVVVESDQGFGRWKERKYYAQGTGLISENGELNLVLLGKPGG